MEKVVTQLLKCGVQPDVIGIVTPYEGQRAYICQYLNFHGSLRSSIYEELEVASVDSFQGREKDYIIMTCVRSSEHQGIGFLNDPRRLNVALTRSKFGTIVIGNPKVLSKHALWHHLLTHFRDKRCFVEGPLASLKECHMRFGNPRPMRQSNRFTAALDASLPAIPLQGEASKYHSGPGSQPQQMQENEYFAHHDPLSMISQESGMGGPQNPLGMFMASQGAPAYDQPIGSGRPQNQPPGGSQRGSQRSQDPWSQFSTQGGTLKRVRTLTSQPEPPPRPGTSAGALGRR